MEHRNTKAELARHKFYIPRKASFLLGDCNQPRSFRESIRYLSQEYGTPRFFNVMILDAPWPNASAKRKATYNTDNSLNALRARIIAMDLDTYMAPGCLVGMWITNKTAIRDLIIGDDGLFKTWNLSLEQEWAWVKITDQGEPITDLNGVWRKPYEVLLLGRRPENPLQMADLSGSQDVTRRVIAAVPDLHSRKPCVKRLLEPFVAANVGYQALEIYARHLVAGWWSWGDEVLKFNWEGCWTNRSSTL
jgi:N6-adenosine-specific RNA methylase IME4